MHYVYLLTKIIKGLAPFEVRRAARLSRLRRGLRMGFSTLEMLIAMTLIILTLSAVVLTSFGNQSVLVDSQLDAEALGKAQEILEQTQTLSRKDFQMVNPTTTVQTLGGITYTKKISVVQSDYFTKQITANVSWAGEHNRAQKVELSTLVTNFDNAIGGDTCSSVLPNHGWDTPVIANAVTDINQLIATTTGAYVLTSVDAYKGKLYVTAGQTFYKTDPTLFVFDIAKLKTDPLNALLGKIDNATTTLNGLSSVQVAEGPQNHLYAYVTSQFLPSNLACTQYYNCAQLQIVDVTNPGSMTSASITNLKINDISNNFAGVGNNLFYKNGIVYVGLKSPIAGRGFNIVDVHDPRSPQWLSGYGASTVTGINVSNGYAYLATNDSSNELVVLNISNPSSPTLASSYDASGGGTFGYGYSVAKKGDSLYLGRTYISGAPEFYILDASSSGTMIPATPLGSRDIGVSGSPYSIERIIVRDYLVFLAVTSSSDGKLYIENIKNPTTITDWATPLSLPASSMAYAADCENNDIFVGSVDATNHGYLSIVTSAP